MKPPRTIIFGVEKNGITITVRGKRFGIAKDRKELKALIGKIKLNDDTDIVMFSSSMDFPDEYTSNKTVLAMVEKLQSNQV